ncbi:MAG: prepilin-type N-terminal cleavage/methylation domain-containing protein [Verrucomicrobia bacterium]|nr:prepilin-type N-terminal cleavage/methylation domain-containing protein [Verrucomicrobiota bacterium]
MKRALFPPAFTLVELMAASAVLSILLLVMVGTLDQMSKAWSRSTQRLDAAKELRFALRLMGADLGGAYLRWDASADMQNHNPINRPIGMRYYTNGGSLNGVTFQPNSHALFFLTSRQPVTLPALGRAAPDLAAVGYYVAWSSHTNVSGMVRSGYNLHRFYRAGTNLWTNLVTYANTPAANFTTLFPLNIQNDEILARNGCNLQVTFHCGSLVLTNNDVVQITEAWNKGAVAPGFWGNRVQMELTVFPQEALPYLTSAAAWSSNASVAKYGRSMEMRFDLERPQ